MPAAESNARWIATSCLMGVLAAAGCTSPVHVMTPNHGDASLTGDAVPTVPKGVFVLTGSMPVAKAFHTATLLPNGKVLIAGGNNRTDEVASAELYDAATGAFSATGRLTTARMTHTATLLHNGKVLIAGGQDKNGPLASAELYDPATARFAPTGNMAIPREVHTATLLENGQVLVTGGFTDHEHEGSDPTPGMASAELYDPDAGTFSPTGDMRVRRGEHAAALLPDGRVLIAGGAYLSSAELYDPMTGAFSATGSMSAARLGHRAVLLPNGQVLMVCGHNAYDRIVAAELYDPAVAGFTAIGEVVEAKSLRTATLLADGRVLMTGGSMYSQFSRDAELYDPAAGSVGTFFATGSMVVPRTGHTATLLGNGAVLIVGGLDDRGYLASAELYQ